MSARDDSFLARWSRRKQAARNAEVRATEDEDHSDEPKAAEAVSEPDETASEQAEAAEANPPEPLPRLEDITADTDLTGFLRKGVPKALKNAALRKMWSLDPAIRDYVGPAEYAWDFNEPGAMRGFGPLETKESVAGFLATMSGAGRADPESAAVPPDASPAPRRVAASSAEEEAASPDEPTGASGPGESAGPPPSTSDHVEVVGPDPAEPADPLESPPTPPPPRHGGAVPR